MKYSIIILLFFFSSCKSQEDSRNVELTVFDYSDKKIDSIYIYFLNQKRVIKNLKSKEKLKLEFTIKDKDIPKGERGVFSIVTFQDDYFLQQTNGFIGFPYSKMEDSYEFYISNDYITIEKDFVPTFKREKQNISEFRG
ncbi:MAG: hypothetical protein ACK4IX_17580 [Candidatus Sericytochromatia bacterium]